MVPDGNRGQGRDHPISLWDPSTKLSPGILGLGKQPDDALWFRSMALSRDGEVLIGPADSGHAIAIWDFPTRHLRQTFPVFHGRNGVGPLAISPDGSRLAMGNVDSANISIWDLRLRKLLVTLGGHVSAAVWFAWSPDGTRLVSSGNDQTIRVWDSRSAYNIDAEPLVDRLFERNLLAEEVDDLDPELPLSNVSTLEQYVYNNAAQPRLDAALLAVFSGVAVLIAAIGVYGVLAYSVNQRTREIGLRMALGAQPGGVLRWIVSRGMIVALAGIAIGLVIAFAMGRVLSSLLFDIQPRDMTTFATVAVILAVVAFVACLVPAARAAQMDPLVALREE